MQHSLVVQPNDSFLIFLQDDQMPFSFVYLTFLNFAYTFENNAILTNEKNFKVKRKAWVIKIIVIDDKKYSLLLSEIHLK
jgi:hypothetical protein